MKNDKDAGSEKLKALKLTIEKIDKDFGKGSVMMMNERAEQQMEVISTGSIGLDIALGVGGLPRGRVTGLGLALRASSEQLVSAAAGAGVSVAVGTGVRVKARSVVVAVGRVIVQAVPPSALSRAHAASNWLWSLEIFWG